MAAGPFGSAMKKMINHERGMFGLCSDQTLSSIDANQKLKLEIRRLDL